MLRRRWLCRWRPWHPDLDLDTCYDCAAQIMVADAYLATCRKLSVADPSFSGERQKMLAAIAKALPER